MYGTPSGGKRPIPAIVRGEIDQVAVLVHEKIPFFMAPHEEHQRLLDWCGGSFDPAAFDLQGVNDRLFEIKF
ncbi:hypothetical protein [Paraburkholderia humisilvae]|uniref:Uncharacterized protein n=1 Tax=Paraburkholderia humisilvae TaxID=627669 RepID=A0A6J5FCZ1_9BURK|nr:hypothetical protein [Paraburkholderia humisilvae]CAB3775095.1 hypothetical protein LMG29542_08477 [Paraburkholderia humisilvae]